MMDRLQGGSDATTRLIDGVWIVAGLTLLVASIRFTTANSIADKHQYAQLNTH
ncbi:MAG: hypothetical protein ACOYMW_09115 [Candidatus Competibacteraceae bacterium]